MSAADCSCFIKHRSDFVHIFRRGRIFRHERWRLYACPNRLNRARFAVVISKRHIRLAVNRNRVRRQLREFFRQELQPTLPAMDFIFRSMAVILPRAERTQIRLEFRTMIEQASKKRGAKK